MSLASLVHCRGLLNGMCVTSLITEHLADSKVHTKLWVDDRNNPLGKFRTQCRETDQKAATLRQWKKLRSGGSTGCCGTWGGGTCAHAHVYMCVHVCMCVCLMSSSGRGTTFSEM